MQTTRQSLLATFMLIAYFVAFLNSDGVFTTLGSLQ